MGQVDVTSSAAVSVQSQFPVSPVQAYLKAFDATGVGNALAAFLPTGRLAGGAITIAGGKVTIPSGSIFTVKNGNQSLVVNFSAAAVSGVLAANDHAYLFLSSGPVTKTVYSGEATTQNIAGNGFTDDAAINSNIQTSFGQNITVQFGNGATVPSGALDLGSSSDGASSWTTASTLDKVPGTKTYFTFECLANTAKTGCFTSPVAGNITKITVTEGAAFTVADNTLTFTIGGVAIAGGSLSSGALTVPTSGSAIGGQVTTAVTSANTLGAGGTPLKIVNAGGGTGAAVLEVLVEVTQ